MMPFVMTPEMRAKAAATRAARGPRPSMRKAINDKCRSCVFDPQSGLGAWRQQVGACRITDCPLWAVRPVSSGNSVYVEAGA